MPNHFFDALEARAVSPRSIFFRSWPTADAAAWAHADLHARAAQMAGALIARGVAPGDRVAAQVEKSKAAFALYLGTLKAGAVFLPLNTAYTAGEVEHFLRDAAPRLVVCDPARRDVVGALAQACGVGAVETLDAEGRGSLADLAGGQASTIAAAPRRADDLAAILYTSGTTGRSKGAMLTHGNLVSNAEALVGLWRFTAADRLLHALPTYHTHGLFTAATTALFAGASLLFMPRFDAEAVIEALPEATAMMGVPTFYTRLLDHPGFTREASAHVRLFTSGSAPLLAETHRAFAARTGHAILERYGMTETNMTTSNPYAGERRRGTVGFPLPDVALRIVDPETGAPRDIGEVGMIEVSGPNVFAGYWRAPEKTAAEFRPDGFFITGDLGHHDADGYLHIVGRGKDLIITGGFNVYPKEVELAVDAIAGVGESAVIGLPHKDLGEAVAVVVACEPSACLDEAAVMAALADSLARFKLPKRVFFVAELPRNSMGKVQKKALRADYADAFTSSGDPA